MIMQKILIVIMLMAAAIPATADAIRINSKEEFLEAIQTPFLFEDFNQYAYGSKIALNLKIDENNYSVVLASSRRIYSTNMGVSTMCVNDHLIMDFSRSQTPITAIGGNFGQTNFGFADLEGNMKVSLSDGSMYEIENANRNYFLGLISTDGTAFQRLEISVFGSPGLNRSWPTVDNLYIGSAIHAPEPSSILLLATGFCGIGLLARKRYIPKHQN
jgi:hypothetical protein